MLFFLALMVVCAALKAPWWGYGVACAAWFAIACLAHQKTYRIRR